MQRTPRPKFLVRLSAVIESFCAIICSITLFSMMALTFVDVLGRYVFSFPIFGSVEIVGILLALTVFSGLCIAVRHDDQIAVELIGQGDGQGAKVLQYIIQIASVVALAVIFYVLAHEAISDFEKGVRLLILDIGRGLVTSAIAFLAGLAFLLQLALLLLGTLEDDAEGAP